MNKEQVEGQIEGVKGKVKEVTGNIIGNKNLESEGIIEKNIGKAHTAYGDALKVIKDDIENS